uniref:Uncharacterized protein n=1 Tax=Physcomitrium patens TaxID=3218 RepID=A0A2K1KL48_PHYPA|nr:hypothetical protein PHYPA_008176 [Physcomitrium patens]
MRWRGTVRTHSHPVKIWVRPDDLGDARDYCGFLLQYRLAKWGDGVSKERMNGELLWFDHSHRDLAADNPICPGTALGFADSGFCTGKGK